MRFMDHTSLLTGALRTAVFYQLSFKPAARGVFFFLNPSFISILTNPVHSHSYYSSLYLSQHSLMNLVLFPKYKQMSNSKQNEAFTEDE